MINLALQSSPPLGSARNRSPQKTNDQISLCNRLRRVNERLRSKKLEHLLADLEGARIDPSGLMNRLMSLFRDSRSLEIYAILYELNYKPFMSQILHGLRRYSCCCDPQDIFQEVFLSIYRYASGFREENKNSFRNWSRSIIRNATLKHLNRMHRHPPFRELDADMADPLHGLSPLERLMEKERRNQFRKLYCISLTLYLHGYATLLTAREQKALHLAEVESLPYRQAAKAMGIHVDNFKMTVCRARKKIYRGLQAHFDAVEGQWSEAAG